jgi:hypothetical protein
MQRRLEDRIRQLCATVIATEDGDSLKEALAELRAALHQHTQLFREKAARYPLAKERRTKTSERSN